MSDATAKLLGTLADRPAVEVLEIESEPAFLETAKGARTVGRAKVTVSRPSITVRFTSDTPVVVDKAAYGESSGRIAAVSGDWAAERVNDAGPAANGDRLFGTQELMVSRSSGAEPDAATRLVFAGAAWRGSVSLEGRSVVSASLSKETVSHHDARLSIAIEGHLDETMIAAVDRASSFIAGLDLELLSVESFSTRGGLLRTRHLRGYRRVGRGPHSPFVGIADEYRMQAWAALVTAIPRLEREGVPIVTMINHVASHNAVAEINTGAALLLLTTQTAAYHRMHGREIGEGAASRRPELMALSRALNLNLSEEDMERFEKLRVELLDGGFFHKPGYETGRPQKDIKFLRDVAHMTVFRLCGYSGPFYGAETFTVRTFAEEAKGTR